MYEVLGNVIMAP